MLPTFLVIGAQKAATTSLHAFLGEHPDIFLPDLKETNFFLEEEHGTQRRAWYESLFDEGRDAAHRGDVSPGYSMFPFYRGVAERAAITVPDARIIYLIRHPIDRMVSSWAQGIGAGIEDQDLEEAMLFASNYLLPSCYGLQLSRWKACFPSEQILVIRSEDLAADPGATLDRVLRHLSLPAGWRPSDEDARHNQATEKLITRARARRVAGMLRRGGLHGPALWLTPTNRAMARTRLARPMVPSDLDLAPEVKEALLACLRSDATLLRSMVGPDLDLWGLA